MTFESPDPKALPPSSREDFDEQWPSGQPDLAAAHRLLAPLKQLFSPVFVDFDQIPETGPLLFVGNHTLFGVIDAPFLVAEIHLRRGVLVRSLGDHAHFQIPGWRDFLGHFGTVDGTRENCARLMKAGASILVFPGGAREVSKRKGQRYQLLWRERMGFARLAKAHECTIVPFSAVGVEDAFDILLDGDDLMASPLGALIRRAGIREDLLPPMVRGVGPTPLPRPERLYFKIGAPLDPNDFGDPASLRDATRSAVETGIADLLAFRSTDPERKLAVRLQRRLRERVERRLLG